MLDVLVVADDLRASRLYRHTIDQTPGFRSRSQATSHQGALESLERRRADVTLVDLTHRPAHGLSLCRALAGLDDPPDLIVTTPSSDLTTLRTAVRLGALHILLLPLDRTALQERLRAYARYRAATASPRRITTQREVDSALAHLREQPRAAPPKGLCDETLSTVRAALTVTPDGLSAHQVADLTSLSRVTARRYLEHLVVTDECVREPVRGRRGRPMSRYSLRPAPLRTEDH